MLKIQNFLSDQMKSSSNYYTEADYLRENNALRQRILEMSNLLSVMIEDEGFGKKGAHKQEMDEKLFQKKKRNNYKMLSVCNEDYLRLQRQYELMVLREYPEKIDEQIAEVKERIRNERKRIHDENYESNLLNKIFFSL